MVIHRPVPKQKKIHQKLGMIALLAAQLPPHCPTTMPHLRVVSAGYGNMLRADLLSSCSLPRSSWQLEELPPKK